MIAKYGLFVLSTSVLLCKEELITFHSPESSRQHLGALARPGEILSQLVICFVQIYSQLCVGHIVFYEGPLTKQPSIKLLELEAHLDQRKRTIELVYLNQHYCLGREEI